MLSKKHKVLENHLISESAHIRTIILLSLEIVIGYFIITDIPNFEFEHVIFEKMLSRKESSEWKIFKSF